MVEFSMLTSVKKHLADLMKKPYCNDIPAQQEKERILAV